MRGAQDATSLSVTNYITSAGSLNPTRMIEAMRGALEAGGYRAKQPSVKAYPLTWAWIFDAPNKVYQATVVGAAAGPFVQAMEGVGPTISTSPTSKDSADLPSVGTVIVFEDVALPKGADLNVLLGALRTAKTTAARGSNATNGGQIQLRLQERKKMSPVAAATGIGLAALLGYYLIQGSTQAGTPGTKV